MNISELLNYELNRNVEFKNWHGITKENIDKHIVQPFLINVYSENVADAPTKMWVVLKEKASEEEGFLIAYYENEKVWCLVETLDDGRFYCDTAGDSTLYEALSNM